MSMGPNGPNPGGRGLSQPVQPKGEKPEAGHVLYTKGGPYVASCEQTMPGLKVTTQDVCTVDEFKSNAWAVAVELGCQLQKAQNTLDLVTHKLQQAAKRRQEQAAERKQQQAEAPETLGGKLDTEVSFADLSDCSLEGCDRCLGQKHIKFDNGKELLLIPQPRSTGLAYSYEGDKVKYLESETELLEINRTRINEALQYASGLGSMEDFTQTEKFYFSVGVQQRLRYKGNDPAILMELSEPQSAYTSSASCIGTPNQNVIDGGNHEKYFARVCQPDRPDECRVPDASQVRSYWRGISRYPFVAVASRVSLGADDLPMGTVAVDVNMSGLSEKFLEGLTFVPELYSMIVSKDGQILCISKHGLKTIFDTTSIEKLFKTKGDKPSCHKGMTQAELQGCTWDYVRPYTLQEASAEKYTTIDFRGVLKNLTEETHWCEDDMQEGRLTFVRPSDQREVTHKLVFCTFRAVPDWGLIMGTELTYLTKAAVMEVNESGFSLEQSMLVDGDFELRRYIELTNVGRIGLPWMVDGDADGEAEESSAFWSISPRTGFLRPNSSQNLTMLFKLHWEDHGHFLGHARIRGNPKWDRGTCFRSERLRFEIKLMKKLGFLDAFMRQFPVCILVAFTLLVLALAAKYTRKSVKRYWKTAAHQAKVVEEAIHSVKNLSHPMVLMPAVTFKNLGRLVSHEEAQHLHLAIWLYSVQEVEAFCKVNHIIFVSHQWTGWQSPDPTNQQYKAMVMSIETLTNEKQWREEDMYIWVDYTSIPQRHPGTQRLAINSLTVYASNVSAFVVVAPPIMHKDIQEECNKETYQRRAWCRAEQLSHLLAAGTDKMYLAESGVLTPLSNIDHWLEQSIYVFSGELTCCRRNHTNMEKCDKEFLVVPMLGLWGQLCQKCEDPAQCNDELLGIHDSLAPVLEDVFPRSFSFSLPSGKTEQRNLFGSLLELLPEALALSSRGAQL